MIGSGDGVFSSAVLVSVVPIEAMGSKYHFGSPCRILFGCLRLRGDDCVHGFDLLQRERGIVAEGELS